MPYHQTPVKKAFPLKTITRTDLFTKLNNPELFRDKALVGGEWVDSKSGKRFDVYDPGNGKVWATAPDCTPEDTDAAVKAAHAAFQDYKKVNPKTRAQCLLKWDALIRENRDDLASIVTYETGKPLAESQGELDYALGFTWWFAGEAERVQGTIQTPSAPGRRVFTVKQPIGVAVAGKCQSVYAGRHDHLRSTIIVSFANDSGSKYNTTCRIPLLAHPTFLACTLELPNRHDPAQSGCCTRCGMHNDRQTVARDTLLCALTRVPGRESRISERGLQRAAD